MRRTLSLASVLLAMTSGLVAQTRARPAHDTASADQPWPTGTFSILAYDPATGEIGAAVQSRVFSVGNGVLWAEAGVGAAATQAIVDVSYGPQALELLRQGRTPEEIVKTIWERDPDSRADWPKAGRQFAVIDAKGNVYAYTGPKATEWAGNKSCTAANSKCTAQGNILAGPGVVDSMVAFFERTPGHLSFRLLAALEGGQLGGRRQTRPTVRRHGHREKGRWRVAAQRHRPSSASRRQPRADQRVAASGGEGRNAAKATRPLSAPYGTVALPLLHQRLDLGDLARRRADPFEPGLRDQ